MDTEFIQPQPIQSPQPIQPQPIQSPQPIQPQQSGLSITSFILSIVGRLLCVSIIGLFLGIPLAFLGLIFGIVALIKKQKKGLAIMGVLIGLMVTISSVVIAMLGISFLENNTDIWDPIKELQTMIQTDSQIQEMMKQPGFQSEFEERFKSNFYGTFRETEVNNREEAKSVLALTFAEMKNTMLQLKDEYTVLGTGIILGNTGLILENTGVVVETGIQQTGTLQTGGALPVVAMNACKTNDDCIPLPSECHPTSCINKTFESKYTKPEMCTMMFVIEAAYSAKDCACQNNVCTNKNLGKK